MRNEVFKWSYDGSYIAKETKKVIQKEKDEEAKDGEEAQIEESEGEEKTYISIFEMPSCKLLMDS